MKTFTSFLFATLLLGVFSQANAALIKQDIVSIDNATGQQSIIGFLEVNANEGEEFGNSAVFTEESAFNLSLFGFDFNTEWEVSFLDAGLDLNDLYAGFINISFDLFNIESFDAFSLYADTNPYSWDHSTHFALTGLQSFSDIQLGDVSVVSEPYTLAMLAFGLGLISLRRKRSK